MSLSNNVWEKVRLLNRIPGAHQTYKMGTRVIYRNGKLVHIRRGPAAGLRWRHYSCFQPWMAMGLYEPHVATLITQMLKPGHVFYDIGANAGYFTLIGAKAVGKDGKVVAFDPNPVNTNAINSQLHLNGFAETSKVERLAISGENGTAGFVITDVNANAHLCDLAAPHLSNKGESIAVQTVTLDNYVRTNPLPHLIKMDIEGAEVAALKGARSLLGNATPPVLLVSTHGDELDRQCKEILGQFNYTFANLTGFEQMIVAIPSTPLSTC